MSMSENALSGGAGGVTPFGDLHFLYLTILTPADDVNDHNRTREASLKRRTAELSQGERYLPTSSQYVQLTQNQVPRPQVPRRLTRRRALR
jgi:hypothetical protein